MKETKLEPFDRLKTEIELTTMSVNKLVEVLDQVINTIEEGKRILEEGNQVIEWRKENGRS